MLLRVPGTSIFREARTPTAIFSTERTHPASRFGNVWLFRYAVIKRNDLDGKGVRVVGAAKYKHRPVVAPQFLREVGNNNSFVRLLFGIKHADGKRRYIISRRRRNQDTPTYTILQQRRASRLPTLSARRSRSSWTYQRHTRFFAGPT